MRYLDGADRAAVTDRAVAALTELVAETHSPQDAYLLAQVYRTAGMRDKSTVVLNSLLKADPRNLEFHIMALEELTEMGDLARAEPFAKRLLQLHPADFRAVAAVGRFECRAGRPARALDVAEAYTRTADPAAGDLPAKSARAAELLDDLARRPGIKGTPAGAAMVRAAVAKYETLLAVRPEALVAAAGLLGADRRATDAFTLIERQALLRRRCP